MSENDVRMWSPLRDWRGLTVLLSARTPGEFVLPLPPVERIGLPPAYRAQWREEHGFWLEVADADGRVVFIPKDRIGGVELAGE